MIKMLAMIRRRDDLSFEDFRRIWCDEHPDYVRALPGIRRYVQDLALQGRRPWPCDGVAELWFDDKEAFKAAMSSSAGEAAREHELQFAADSTWFLAEERHVDL